MRKFTRYQLLPIWVALFLSHITCFSQDTTAIQWIDISRVHFVRSLSNSAYNVFVDKKVSLEENYSKLSFRKGMRYSGSIPANEVTKKSIVRFHVFNSSDTISRIWFFPGFFYWGSKLYRLDSGKLNALPLVKPSDKDYLGYSMVSLAPNDSATIYAELSLVKTYINTLRPRLVNENRIKAFMSDIQASHTQSNSVTFLFSGLLLMMILFSIANFVLGGNKEFLFYSGYAFFLGGMLFTKALFDFRLNQTSYFLEGYLDYVMMGIGIIFYMLFMKGFLQTKTKHPFLHKLYNVGIVMLLLSLLSYSYLHYFSDNFWMQNLIENITKILLLVMTVIFLIYGVRHWDDKLLRYLFWGNLCLFVFSLISTILVITDADFLPGLFGNALLYYELGIFLELVFFLSGLNFKNRQLIIEQTSERERLRAENQLKEYEKELAVYKAQQEERQRISADMHDELGAGMTAIRLMSEIARNKMKENTPVEIERISQSADEVLNKMNAIIWSMNSGNDTVDNLISYIRSYALEYFENTSIDCKVITPVNISDTELTGDKRRNIFLCVKETLNNVLKHSKASHVEIEFKCNHQLNIRIQDDGVGIDLQRLRQFGNGLKNITRRMESIGGTYQIDNHHGTQTKLSLPLN